MPAENQDPITVLLNGMLDEDADQRDGLFDAVYHELRRMAQRLMSRERAGHTWQATELVHEIYSRVLSADDLEWVSRRAFYSVVAKSMKRLLAEHARKKKAVKRGGQELVVALDDVGATSREEYEYSELEDELNDLRKINQTAAEILDLRLFAGLTLAEISTCLDVPLRSVERHVSTARGWLRSRRARHEPG